jgi:hypothetical protein
LLKILTFCLAICYHLIGLWGEHCLTDKDDLFFTIETGNLSKKSIKQRGKGAVAKSNN